MTLGAVSSQGVGTVGLSGERLLPGEASGKIWLSSANRASLKLSEKIEKHIGNAHIQTQKLPCLGIPISFQKV